MRSQFLRSIWFTGMVFGNYIVNFPIDNVAKRELLSDINSSIFGSIQFWKLHTFLKYESFDKCRLYISSSYHTPIHIDLT